MKKRISAFLLAAVMVISCSGLALAASTSSGSVSLNGPKSAKAGDTVTVYVELAENLGIAGLQLLVSYDSTYLTLESSSKGDAIFDGVTFSQSTNANPYTINCDSTTNTTETGTLATLTFKVSSTALEGTTKISCSVEKAFNEKGTKISVGGSSLTISIDETPKNDFPTSITLGDQFATYDGKTHDAEISGTLPAGTSVDYTYNGSSTAPTNAGTYEVVATLSGDGYNTTTLNATLTIEKAPITVTADNMTKVQGDDDLSLIHI